MQINDKRNDMDKIILKPKEIAIIRLTQEQCANFSPDKFNVGSECLDRIVFASNDMKVDVVTSELICRQAEDNKILIKALKDIIDHGDQLDFDDQNHSTGIRVQAIGIAERALSSK